MTSKTVIACCAGILIGVGASALVPRPRDAPAAARLPAAEHDRAADRRVPDVIERTGARIEDLRRLVAEEIRGALHDQPAAPAPPAGAEAPAPEPTPAFDQTKDHLAQRIALGTWTATDRDWMRTALRSVNTAERTELIRQVLIATNTGKLHFAVGGPPF